MARSLARRRSVAGLLLLAVALVVAFAAVAKLPSSFLKGLRQSSHLLSPFASARRPDVQRHFFSFPDFEAEERERQRKLKEKQEAEAAATRRDLLTKGGVAVLGLAGAYAVVGPKETSPASPAGKQPASPAGKKPASPAGTKPATPAVSKVEDKSTATPSTPPTKVQGGPPEVDPKASKRVQEAQKALKRAEDARAKDAEEKKKNG